MRTSAGASERTKTVIDSSRSPRRLPKVAAPRRYSTVWAASGRRNGTKPAASASPVARSTTAIIWPGCSVAPDSRRKGVMAFCRSLPLNVWTSPSFDTTVPKPAGLASTCAQGRGVDAVSRRRVSVSKRNGQVEAGGTGPGAMRRFLRSRARKAASSGAGRPVSRAISRRRRPLVGRAAGEQQQLDARLGGDLDPHRQAGGGVEGVERALVVHRAAGPRGRGRAATGGRRGR